MSIADWFRPKWKHPNRDVREAAVRRLKNQEALAHVAQNDEDAWVRMFAVTRVTLQEVVADIAKNDKDSRVRRAAIRRLGQANVLAEIAMSDPEVPVREYAVKWLFDQRARADIAKNARNSSVRAAAARLLHPTRYADLLRILRVEVGTMSAETNPSILAHIAKCALSSEARAAALKRVTDQRLLANIATNDEFCYVRQAARARFVDQTALSHPRVPAAVRNETPGRQAADPCVFPANQEHESGEVLLLSAPLHLAKNSVKRLLRTKTVDGLDVARPSSGGKRTSVSVAVDNVTPTPERDVEARLTGELRRKGVAVLRSIQGINELAVTEFEEQVDALRYAIAEAERGMEDARVQEKEAESARNGDAARVARAKHELCARELAYHRSYVCGSSREVLAVLLSIWDKADRAHKLATGELLVNEGLADANADLQAHSKNPVADGDAREETMEKRRVALNLQADTLKCLLAETLQREEFPEIGRESWPLARYDIVGVEIANFESHDEIIQLLRAPEADIAPLQASLLELRDDHGDLELPGERDKNLREQRIIEEKIDQVFRDHFRDGMTLRDRGRTLIFSQEDAAAHFLFGGGSGAREERLGGDDQENR
jgi:hypothetical protein